MKTGIAITVFGVLALLGPWTLVAEEQTKPTDRSVLRGEVDKRKAKLAEAKEDLEATRRGVVSLKAHRGRTENRTP